MPRIDQQITFIYTRDLAGSAAFYAGVLALPLVVDQGSCRIYRVTNSSYLGICQRANAPDGRDQAIILTLVTPDVDAWYADLVARGVQFDHPPVHNPTYRIYHCFLRDPNGYLIEIQRFDDPFGV